MIPPASSPQDRGRRKALASLRTIFLFQRKKENRYQLCLLLPPHLQNYHDRVWGCCSVRERSPAGIGSQGFWKNLEVVALGTDPHCSRLCNLRSLVTSPFPSLLFPVFLLLLPSCLMLPWETGPMKSSPYSGGTFFYTQTVWDSNRDSDKPKGHSVFLYLFESKEPKKTLNWWRSSPSPSSSQTSLWDSGPGPQALLCEIANQPCFSGNKHCLCLREKEPQIFMNLTLRWPLKQRTEQSLTQSRPGPATRPASSCGLPPRQGWAE